MDKRSLNERDICTKFITPALIRAGWDIQLQVRGEVRFTKGRILMFALMSEPMQSIIAKNSTGMTAKGIKAAKLKQVPIPVPPLAEQHRIVAKVDELMALCDKLEASLAMGCDSRHRLLGALLGEAMAPADRGLQPPVLELREA